MTEELYERAKALPCVVYLSDGTTTSSEAGFLEGVSFIFDGEIGVMSRGKNYKSFEFAKSGEVMFDRIVQLLDWGVDIQSIELKLIEGDNLNGI